MVCGSKLYDTVCCFLIMLWKEQEKLRSTPHIVFGIGNSQTNFMTASRVYVYNTKIKLCKIVSNSISTSARRCSDRPGLNEIHCNLHYHWQVPPREEITNQRGVIKLKSHLRERSASCTASLSCSEQARNESFLRDR